MSKKAFIALVAFVFIAVGSLYLKKYIYEKKSDSVMGYLEFYKSDNKTKKIDLLVSKTPAEREKGLMFVKSMPKNQGMLFIYEDVSFKNMWMKNTYIPLDMIFISEDKVIKNIVRNTVPQSMTNISSILPVKYVLEVNGGFATEHNININDRVEFKLEK